MYLLLYTMVLFAFIIKPIYYLRRLYSYTLNSIIIVLFNICYQLSRDSVFLKYGAYECV